MSICDRKYERHIFRAKWIAYDVFVDLGRLLSRFKDAIPSDMFVPKMVEPLLKG